MTPDTYPRQMTLNARQFQQRQKERENIRAFMAALAEAGPGVASNGWMRATWLCLRLNRSKRQLRETAEAAGGHIISRTHCGGGYKLTVRATADEVVRASKNYRARGEKEIQRAVDTLRVFHMAPGLTAGARGS